MPLTFHTHTPGGGRIGWPHPPPHCMSGARHSLCGSQSRRWRQALQSHHSEGGEIRYYSRGVCNSHSSILKQNTFMVQEVLLIHVTHCLVLYCHKLLIFFM